MHDMLGTEFDQGDAHALTGLVQSTSPYGFAAISAVIGMFSQQAVLKLKDVPETLLTKPQPGILVEGQLAAGTYSFFTIPSEKRMDGDFQPRVGSWGAFNYNPDFDALRVKIKAQSAELMEWLNFSFDPTGEKSANVILRWEKLKLSLKIEDAIAR